MAMREPDPASKDFLVLVESIRQWARSMGASHSFVHVTTGSQIKATDKLMKAAGRVMIGGAYCLR